MKGGFCARRPWGSVGNDSAQKSAVSVGSAPQESSCVGRIPGSPEASTTRDSPWTSATVAPSSGLLRKSPSGSAAAAAGMVKNKHPRTILESKILLDWFITFPPSALPLLRNFSREGEA